MILELAHTETGAGAPLVVLHGLFGSARNWAMIARSLGDAHRVLALDLRNHGNSPWSERMDYPAMAGDVAGFIERHGIGPCPVLGHSMGGKVAMWLALQRPDLVSAVIPADVAPVPYDSTLLAYVHAMRAVELDRYRRRAEVEAALAGTIPEAGIRSFLMQNLVAEGGELRWRINLEAIERSFDLITGFPETDLDYGGPALFLDGDRSAYIRPEHEPAIRRLFPRARIETIRDAGHWLHAEQPEQVLRALTRFLGEIA
ncbi:alpha/beta fold hydrolase [Arenibaculum sp.]|uniref:alpha/beta fold hydrolase n=1 Tax=Arenibaculum sp. TaxID=2865862 RepID=UPI002E12EB74|nr:alpha/beta fold hydrolase [Arenibaculum sp.]